MTDSTSPTAAHVPTLMTTHAHPDDETIGTGGTMAQAVRDGRRVVLVTCTRGEQGDIVVPSMDTAENHRRLGEIRAAELEAAMAALGVTEWDNLGYRDSDMMGRPGNRDPRTFWQADVDEAIGRMTWMVRRFRPDVMTTYNDFGGYGHPDHIRTNVVAVGAFARAGDPAWYPEQLAPEHGGGPSARRTSRLRRGGRTRARISRCCALRPRSRSSRARRKRATRVRRVCELAAKLVEISCASRTRTSETKPARCAPCGEAAPPWSSRAGSVASTAGSTPCGSRRRRPTVSA